MDPAEVAVKYAAAVVNACNAAAGESLDVADEVAAQRKKILFDPRWSSYKSSDEFMAEVTTCTINARNARRVTECDHMAEVELLNRDPESFAGQCVQVVARIIQFDQGTGPCAFRAAFDIEPLEYSYEYRGENAIFTFATPCPQLAKVGVDDVVGLKVVVRGGITYDTTIGGSATAVDFAPTGPFDLLQDN
jgi:hypothetical protein